MESGQEKTGSFPLGQMNSMSPECTELKQKYDRCFHNWFKSYLEASTRALGEAEQYSNEPGSWRSRGTSLFTSSQNTSQKLAALRARYDNDCGTLFTKYRECIQVRFLAIFNIQHALKEKGLEDAIEKARQENPFLSQPDHSL